MKFVNNHSDHRNSLKHAVLMIGAKLVLHGIKKVIAKHQARKEAERQEARLRPKTI